MPGGFTGGIEKGLKLAIPLAMKSMDLDMARAKLDLETQQYQDELFKEAQKIEKEAIEAKRKIAVDSVERTKEALDAAHEGNAAPDVIAELKAQQAINLEKAGLPPQIIPRILQEDEAERALKAKLKEAKEVTIATETAKKPFKIATEKRAKETQIEKEQRERERELVDQVREDLKGEKLTTLQKNAPFVAKTLGISEKEAIQRLMKKEGGEYKISQRIDDARAFYAMKMKSLIDPMGMGVLEGKEAEYNQLIGNLQKDLKLIMESKKPVYLKEPTETDPLGIR